MESKGGKENPQSSHQKDFNSLPLIIKNVFLILKVQHSKALKAGAVAKNLLCEQVC